MAISDRTRKLLWGRSGNRCALCRRLLSVDPTESDPASVLGEECHIVGRSAAGPRSGTIEPDQLDSESNLILLCRVDHKRVDDQASYFSSERLRSTKAAHESWVETMLADRPPQSFEARLRPSDKDKRRLKWIANGPDLLGVIFDCMAYDFDNDDLTDETEVSIVADFLQLLHDYGEQGEDMESGERVRARFELSKEIDRLMDAGFWVFGGRVQRVLEANGQNLQWPVATVRVKRFGDMLLEKAKEIEREQSEAGKRPSQTQAASG